jgi:tetratricopeptide (TPR) repeat protein
MLRIIRILLPLCLCFTGYVRAQENTPERYLEVRGNSEFEMEPLARATINLYEGSTKVKTIQTDADGSFSFKLDVNKQYVIEVEKDGLISKRISFNTQMPDEEKGVWMNEFSIGLMKQCSGVDYSVLKEPVDRVSFDAKRREFISDKEYVAKMRPRIESLLTKNDQCMLNTYESLVKKGDQLAGQKNNQEAISAYREALEMFPRETYPAKQISELNSKINKQQNSTEAYQKTIAEADALSAQQKYSEALQKYKIAANLNPQETYPRQKVSEIETSLAQQQAVKQALLSTEDRYNQAMARASVAYTRKDLATAKQYYQEALMIKPGESLPKTRVQEIETAQAKEAAADASKAAEVAKKATFENDYRALVASADEQYKAKKYDEAKASYAKALTMKPSESYPAQRVKTIDNVIATEQASIQKNKENNYNAAMTAANNAIAKSQFPLARESLLKALSFKPDDLTAKNRIVEMDKLVEDFARRKSTDEQYISIIQTADGYLANKERTKAKESYLQALTIKPGDQYAQSKVTAIDNSVAAELAVKLKANEDGYKAAIGAANTAITQRMFAQAKEYLQRALTIKPGDAYATSKTAEIDRLIQEQKKGIEQEQLIAKQYNDVIAAADKSFNELNYSGAKSSYARALQMKPGDTYASQKIVSIDNILAAEMANKQKQLEDAYKSSMDRGTSAMVIKDYKTAKDAFQQALAVKQTDVSAKLKLNEVELLIKQEQNRIAAGEALKKNYDETIKVADQYLTQKNFSNAKASYEKALDLRPGEAYPKQKLAETTTAIAEQERLLTEKQAKDNAYNLALKNADKFFRAKDYQQARDEYSRALTLKPNEIFPKNKLAEMENLIGIKQKAQDEAKAKADAYSAAINAGNAAFNGKDYVTARSAYTEALKHMPGDLLATDQIKKIDYILTEAERLKKAELDRKNVFDALIASADKLYDAGSYPAAKDSYKKALTIEPNNVYAKQRITRIDEITRALSQTPAKTNNQSSTSIQKVVAAIPMGELSFKNESERQKYLDELKQKYPSGITLEKYKEQYKETYRYIIIRNDQAQEFRHISYTTYSGALYSVNGKPITQQYFLSQIKIRPGEGFKEIDMQ